MMPQLLSYRSNTYSQAGEDGILAELARRLGLERGWCCEFGAWDGRHLSNTFRLLENGWQGVMIECEPTRFAELVRTAARLDGRLQPIQAMVSSQPGPDCLDALLARTPIPREFELLSIDVDGPDYQIWQSLTHYRPLLVVIEIDSSYPPGRRHVHRTEAPSSSFTSTIELGRSKGYVPLVHTGNLIFIREDRAAEVCAGDGSGGDGKEQFLYSRAWARGSSSRLLRYYWQRLENRLRAGGRPRR